MKKAAWENASLPLCIAASLFLYCVILAQVPRGASGLHGEGIAVLHDCEGGGFLQPVRLGGWEIDVCPSCKGMWLGGCELAALVRASGFSEKGSLHGSFVPEELARLAGERTRCCPFCKKGMSKHLLPPDYTIIVDVCMRGGGGVWFDGGECEAWLSRLSGGGEGAPVFASLPPKR